jgi:hypothetical protein
MAETYYRPAPPPSVNGWGQSLDREMAHVRRELDQRADLIEDHEERLRSLERQTHLSSHDLHLISEAMEGHERRLAVQERFARILIAIIGLSAGRFTPDLAVALQIALSGPK